MAARESNPGAAPVPSASDAGAHAIARQTPSTSPIIFPEHWLAHELVDGLTGLEIGAAAHNPFGLETRNVASAEGAEFYAEEQRTRPEVQVTILELIGLHLGSP